MDDHLPPDSDLTQLSEGERAKIRAEARYAVLTAREFTCPEKLESRGSKVLRFLSNGFVLLLIGAAITSGLVPHFQRKYEERKQQYNLKQECLQQFLLYSNSIWQEYYSILPLTQEVGIGKEEYIKNMTNIAQIKLKRYDAFAKVQALAVVFREESGSKGTEVEEALKKYAVSLNTTSAAIDTWLRGLYCTPTTREMSPCATFDPAFDAFSEYEKIKKQVVEVGNDQTNYVAQMIMKHITHRQ